MNLQKDVKYIKGVGETRAKLLNNIGIYTLEDLITYYPRNYQDRNNNKKLSQVIDGETCLVQAIIVSRMSEIRYRKNLTLYKMIIRDETMTATVTWFNQGFLKSRFNIGQEYKFYGKISIKNGRIDILNPTFDVQGENKNTGKIIPIYPLTYNLKQNTIRKIIENALKEVDGKLEETMPKYILEEYKLLDTNSAIRKIHFPESFNDFEIAKKRLVFEELLSMQLALLMIKNKYANRVKGICFNSEVLISEIIDSLPFKLTKAQLKVIEEIETDMESDKPMNRLLQGDVGSR